jgi:hypothetical protein
VPCNSGTALPTDRGRAAALVLFSRGRPALRALAGGKAEGGEPQRELALDGLGHVELADTVFVASEGGRTLGIVFAKDEVGTACLITLDLTDEGAGNWQATVLGTARGSASSWGESHRGAGQAFGFAGQMFTTCPQDAA